MAAEEHAFPYRPPAPGARNMARVRAVRKRYPAGWLVGPGASGQSLDRLDCGRHCFLVGLRPAQVGRKPAKEFFKVKIFSQVAGLISGRLWRRWLLWTHVILVGCHCRRFVKTAKPVLVRRADFQGKIQRPLKSTRASESVGTPLHNAGRYRQRFTTWSTTWSSEGPPLSIMNGLYTWPSVPTMKLTRTR